MRKIISLICILLPMMANAEVLQLQENAPDRYVVVKGDTLWDISLKFFKNPWKWPQVWGYNKDSIKDPHWIYPGDVVYLDPDTHTLRVGEPAVAGNSSETTPNESAVSENPQPASDTTTTVSVLDPSIVKYSPRARAVGRTSDAIPTISLKDIGPFLSRPLVFDENELEGLPQIVGTFEQRKLLGQGDIAYANTLPHDRGNEWQIFRAGSKFVDPDTREVLGYEVQYLGDANVEKFDTVSTLRIKKSLLEIHIGDQLAQATSGHAFNYLPHAPNSLISARIISIYGGVDQAGQNAIITLNKGRRDGLESGHVLALYQKGELIKTSGWFTPNIILPDVRYGLVIVFRVFEKVSYALVMETTLPVTLQDRASTPD